MGQTSVLDRLNASERELLLLLGRGHTAKSIATLTGLSVPAVNERFRSGRRKMGIGSSREIARLLVAQENRDNFIGLAEPDTPSPTLPRQGAPRRASPLKRWSYPMTAAVLLAAAILAQQTSVSPAPTDRPIPPAAAAMFVPPQPAPDLIALHMAISAGPADPTWTRATEVALSRAYHRATDPSGVLSSLDATCNASLCEVLGVSRSGLNGVEINALTEAVQAAEMKKAVTSMKLENIVQNFSTSEGTASDGAAGVVFVAYWRRQPGS